MTSTIQIVGEKCTGCEACIQSCPFDAISMQYNDEGFLYPVIEDEKCRHCGRCVKVCPLLNLDKLQKESLPPKAIAGSNRKKDVLLSSASGGAFTAICDVLQPDIIYGSAWKSKDEVSIISVDQNHIQKLRKSKYIQARVGEAYKQALKDVKEGKKVVFSGTPCQIGGLYSYVGSKPENLYTVEIICHGIGSPGFFKQYIASKEKELGEEIENFVFRDKNVRTGGWLFYTTTITKKGSKEISSYDPFSQLFLNRVIVRKSCETCSYASRNHVSDFIIGDYWGCKKHNPELFDKDGVSVILFMTEKAKVFEEQIKELIQGKDILTENVVAHNASLVNPQNANLCREDFFEDLKKGNTEAVIKKYLPKMSWKRRLFSVYDKLFRKFS